VNKVPLPDISIVGWKLQGNNKNVIILLFCVVAIHPAVVNIKALSEAKQSRN